MGSLVMSKLKLSELLDQVYFSLQEKFIALFKESLQESLEQLRDQIIRTPRYQRGNVLKRWGYTVRKWLTTPIGVIEGVRIPRIRDYCHEVRLFMDSYVKRSALMNALMLEMFVWGISSRRLSILSKKLFSVGVTAQTVSRLQRLVKASVSRLRECRIESDIQILIVDGVYGRYRGRKRGVCLLAIGVDSNGKAHILDWIGASSEGLKWYRQLFRRLWERGLHVLKLLVSDGEPSIVSAARAVWGAGFAHQLCLWHFSQELGRHMVQRHWQHLRRFFRDYWAIFDALELPEAQQRWQLFMQRWQAQEPHAVAHMQRKRQKLLAFLGYPQSWQHRIRTVNLAEGFFARLQQLLKRYPGWVDEEHIRFIVGLFILSSKVFHHNQMNLYQPGIPVNILSANFNRIG